MFTTPYCKKPTSKKKAKPDKTVLFVSWATAQASDTPETCGGASVTFYDNPNHVSLQGQEGRKKPWGYTNYNIKMQQ